MPDGSVPPPPAPLSPSAVASQINATASPSVLIVGAGIGGISLALDLDEAGLTNWLIVDREDAVGGTWWVNRYPGCRCDVPAVAYSHSRFQNSQWTETHPGHSEIQQYWANIVQTQGLSNRIRLQHDYVRADWDAEQNLYHVTLRDLVHDRDVTLDCQVLVGATGGFAEPNRIPLEGEETFKGRVVHAARWPRDLAVEDLRDKDVVVVGNGCSGVQIVGTLGLDPRIRIVSLARAQQWFMPSSTQGLAGARNSSPNSEQLRALRSRFPFIQRLHRLLILAVADSRFKWQYVKEGRRDRKRLERDIGAWMVSRAPKHLKDKIVPDFPFMAKRYIFEDGYFASINQPQNKAVYGRIAGLTPEGVKTDDGSVIPADVVVLSTGYAADHIDMHVAGSTDSTEKYSGKSSMTYYHGMTVPGLPNMYALSGGNNTLVNHSSVTMMLEIQAAYITKMIAAMRDNGIAKLEVKRDAAVKFDKWVERELERTTWPVVNNYWRKDGTGRIFTHYPGSILKFWWQNAYPVWADYEGAEKLAVRQRVRTLLFTVSLLVAAAWGGRTLWSSGFLQQAGGRLAHLLAAVGDAGIAAKDRLAALVLGGH